MASVGNPEVYMWGSDVHMLVHVRDEKYLPLHSGNRNFLRRRKERKGKRKRVREKRQRKLEDEVKKAWKESKKNGWSIYLFSARL